MTEHINHSAEGLRELSVAEMEQVLGGAICHGVSVLAWARVDGSTVHDDVFVDGRIITAEDF